MTKAEAFEMVYQTAKGSSQMLQEQMTLIKKMGEFDLVVQSSAIVTLASVIADTMTNLSLILCELMPDAPLVKETPRGEHNLDCVASHPTCKCNTCIHDHNECCQTGDHLDLKCTTHNCPDYVKEDEHG